MESYEVEEVSRQARKYKIKCKTERIGNGDEFQYKICFGRDLDFEDGRAASMFVEAIIREKKLQEKNGVYRVGFGWEIY